MMANLENHLTRAVALRHPVVAMSISNRGRHTGPDHLRQEFRWAGRATTAEPG